jgi:hypothetical protein
VLENFQISELRVHPALITAFAEINPRKPSLSLSVAARPTVRSEYSRVR